MRPYAFELPEALVHAAQATAQAVQISLTDFVRAAIAEKIAATHTAQYVHVRQAAGPVIAGDQLEPDADGSKRG
jgi:hypothetical protein